MRLRLRKLILRILNQGVITLERDELLKLYYQDVRKYPVLSRTEEEELIRAFKAGDKEAGDKVIKSNLRFVISIAKKYQNRRLSLTDLIQEGVLGLREGLVHYDPDKENRFLSYAGWWVKQRINNYAYLNTGTIKTTLPIQQLSRKLARIARKFEQKHGRMPVVEDYEKLINVPRQMIINALNIDPPIDSLQSTISNNDVMLYEEIVEDTRVEMPEEILMREELSNKIKEILPQLPNKYSDIIRLTFGIDCVRLSDKAISKLFGYVPERVRQLKAAAIRYIRKHFGDELKEFV